ncbi:MAG: hypothetical protein ABI333_27420 [bacterium]
MAVTVVMLTACNSKPVGLSGDGGGVDAASGSDATAGLDAAADPDAGTLVQDVVGWASYAFEHNGFVREAEVDPGYLEGCSPYVTALPGFENWWVNGNVEGYTLRQHPSLPDHGGAIGLIRATGYLSEPGQYGHMGFYDREFQPTSTELLVCETVSALGHCPVPRAADFCHLPEPNDYESRSVRLRQILPGPASNREHYELEVLYNEDIADGTTAITASFTVPLPGILPEQDGWELIPLPEIGELSLVEVHLWFYYEEIPFPNDLDGWVMRDTLSDTLRISLSGRSGGNATIHLWGDFPVDEVIPYP